ncbi:MAG: hypothetical protein ABJB12_03515 [Pseudomonadota bacterium]
MLFVAMLFIGACGDLDPCAGVVVGATYQVQVGATEDEGVDNCSADWGFAAGDTFTATIVDMAGDNDCKSGRAALSGNHGWTLQLTSDRVAGGGGLVEAAYVISRDDCSGPAGIAIGCNDGGCLARGAGSCPCSLSVDAHRDRGTCPGSCSVVLTALVTRL